MRGLNNWRVALRIARRGARKTWGRSLLVVLLIAAPVLALAAAAVLLPSRQSTLAEREHYALGATQARLTVVGGPKDHVTQGVEGGYDYDLTGDSSDETRVDPRTVLPSGTRVLSVTTGALVFAAPVGPLSIAVEAGPSWDQALEGPYEVLSGRRPAADDEVLVTPATLTRLGTAVGGSIRTAGSTSRELRVVGTARDASQPRSTDVVFGASGLLPAAQSTSDTTYWVVDRPVDAALVARLNSAGLTVFSRAFVAHPSAAAVEQDAGGGGVNASIIVIVALALLFALFEVALLAGAAFLVGARQQQRMLAVIASVGAERSVLRRIVTANGVVLGAVGGLLGVGLGIGAAVMVMRLTSDGSWTTYPGLHLWWPLLAGIVVFGVLVGWLAALVPARAAARFDIVRALRGARTPQKTGRRPVLGIVLLAGGVVAVLLGGGVLLTAYQAKDEGTQNLGAYGAVALIGGGSLLAQVGVLLCAGLLLRGIARMLGRAPLGTRLAARDTSRNLGRAVPAVASVMTTVFIAAFVMCIGNTASIYSASTYYWQSALPGLATSSIPTRSDAAATSADAASATAVLRRTLPTDRVVTLGVTSEGPSTSTPSGKAEDAVPWVRIPSLPASCTDAGMRSTADLRCGGFTMNGGHLSQGNQQLTVGPASGLAVVLGRAPSAAALAVLDGGGAVALRSDLVQNGESAVDWFTPKQILDGDPSEEQPVRTTRLTAVMDLPVHVLQTSLYVTPATAERLHMTVDPDHIAMSFTRPPIQSELDSANTGLGALANSPGGGFVTVETGPQDYGTQIAWWVLLGCLVIAIAAGATAVGLARVDGRADDLTLAALGASRRVRRTTGAVQALIVCGVGAVIGTLLGVLPPLAIGQASASYAFAPPVVQLVLVAVGIPVVIAVGAWLLAGRRGDLTRRTAIT